MANRACSSALGTKETKPISFPNERPYWIALQKRIRSPVPVRKLLHSKQEILNREIACYENQSGKDLYSIIFNAFPIPPRNIDPQSYFSARSRAYHIVCTWQRDWLHEAIFERLRAAITEPLLRASLVFELTNFIISATPFLDDTLQYRKNLKSTRATSLKSVRDAAKNLNSLKKYFFESKYDGSLDKVIRELNDIERRLTKKHTAHLNKTALILVDDVYVDTESFPLKTRPLEFYQGIFIFTVSELFKNAGAIDIDYESTFKGLAALLNRSFGFKTTPEQLKDKKRHHGARYSEVFKNNYSAIIDRIISETNLDMAKKLKARLTYFVKVEI